MRPASVALSVMLVAVLGGAPALGYQQPENASAQSPAAVSCSYDETKLREYQPNTFVGHLDVEPSASYGGIYSSPDRETDVYVYFLRYERQDGLTAMDSHVDDREPVYVLVDDRTGEIERVVFSVYHYLKAGATPSDLPMNGSNVQLYVVNPWHQYVPSVVAGPRVELRNYCAVVDDWHANGWRASVAATTNPWTMLQRDSWWANGSVEQVVAERYESARSELADAIPDDIVPDVALDDLVPSVDSGDLVPDVDSGDVAPDDLVPNVNASVPGVGD